MRSLLLPSTSSSRLKLIWVLLILGETVSSLSEQFVCDEGTRTIDSSEICDSHSDCQDGRDERGCYCKYIGQNVCSNSRECYQRKEDCNGAVDCEDGTDEKNCPTTTSKPTTPVPTTTTFPTEKQITTPLTATTTESTTAKQTTTPLATTTTESTTTIQTTTPPTTSTESTTTEETTTPLTTTTTAIALTTTKSTPTPVTVKMTNIKKTTKDAQPKILPKPIRKNVSHTQPIRPSFQSHYIRETNKHVSKSVTHTRRIFHKEKHVSKSASHARRRFPMEQHSRPVNRHYPLYNCRQCLFYFFIKRRCLCTTLYTIYCRNVYYARMTRRNYFIYK